MFIYLFNMINLHLFKTIPTSCKFIGQQTDGQMHRQTAR